MVRNGAEHRADVVVVGAGPAGTSAGWHLAGAGLEVAVLEKAELPREKVCGDGLTPRGVKALHDMDVDTSSPDWVRRRGLRVRGYGWIFGMGDGTANVGYGLLDTRRGTGADRKAILRRWLDTFPAEDGLGEDDAVSPLRGAGLPMALSRGPAYTRGLLLAGDAAGTVNPCNGEGISYALESGRMAAEVAADALAVPAGERREAVLQRYPALLRSELGRHHRLGLGFLALLARPAVVRLATARGLRRPAVADAALRLVGNLTDGRDGDAVDRVLAVLLRLTPAT